MGKGNTLAGEEKMESPSFRIHETKLEEFDRHIDAHDECLNMDMGIATTMQKSRL